MVCPTLSVKSASPAVPYNLYLLPGSPDVAVLWHEAHGRRAALARIGAVALNVSWNGGFREAPDCDAFSFDLRIPHAAIVPVKQSPKVP